MSVRPSWGGRRTPFFAGDWARCCHCPQQLGMNWHPLRPDSRWTLSFPEVPGKVGEGLGCGPSSVHQLSPSGCSGGSLHPGGQTTLSVSVFRLCCLRSQPLTCCSLGHVCFPLSLYQFSLPGPVPRALPEIRSPGVWDTSHQ